MRRPDAEVGVAALVARARAEDAAERRAHASAPGRRRQRRRLERRRASRSSAAAARSRSLSPPKCSVHRHARGVDQRRPVDEERRRVLGRVRERVAGHARQRQLDDARGPRLAHDRLVGRFDRDREVASGRFVVARIVVGAALERDVPLGEALASARRLGDELLDEVRLVVEIEAGQAHRHAVAPAAGDG